MQLSKLSSSSSSPPLTSPLTPPQHRLALSRPPPIYLSVVKSLRSAAALTIIEIFVNATGDFDRATICFSIIHVQLIVANEAVGR